MSQYISDKKAEELEIKANEARELLIEMLTEAGSGHTAGSLGMADIFTAMYFHILNHDPKNPEQEDRDRLILSNGHITPIRYAVMAMAGYFPIEELKTLRKFGTRLQGHPEKDRLPGVETTSGPLGSGLGQAAGYAYAAKMDGKKFRTYCLMSDGEQDAGATWESAMFAGKYKLSNLTAIIDRNNIQIDGMTENIMPLENLHAKYEAFNWHVLEIDGNNIEAFVDAANEAAAIYEKPTVIIAHTIPGKGIKEIEFDYRWHGIPPGAGPEDIFKKSEQAQKFLAELRTLDGKIESEHQ
ncbi:MAG: transketolase [Candidatus Yanofskybacteria bacterium RIFCSPLOWO2_12_FULL_43_11b]|uniref:Transketolase n=1 Tax=Candidatus Yanofskybacteria bacterium RIFCSPLOWO2_12_FULL_43_11b TaxID=1802710 RepID=A0A1F8H6R0_9BACT|nr:MAG: transketolase [Candidatus Yanofskybacteria bacterium RIFCSPHIGHO2_01_FULL_43_32]OGN12144.1 MAG: transketolase [Candidatus Yanofskybacteria bacterium RIFCSPHIGHO2_02_FULL_43_12]OGN18247.1 MAG: transketolase [Candidatus Yanofskybacteria bacterium RIFCSPHIGHO2_12_FULL_43_11]OGN25208.1 MAG: transketolase [Candidatus Yanofskybacteria bacterium RIFCSPLOWO2_01_FULL_43_46]OGN33283.1 MAG: transketolase [Candidatus Yanofskybacteria bacterium RIFCSPLOWO2_12_FULL_43_11b]